MNTTDRTEMKRKRTPIPKKIAAEILYECRRRCAICFGLNGDTTPKKGQVAHINKNASKSKKSDLVHLCFSHHDEYDSTTRQSRGITQHEVRVFKTDLLSFVKKGKLITSITKSTERTPNISAEIYKLRLPVYQAVKSLLGEVERDTAVSNETLNRFCNTTDAALFLFGKKMDDYIRDIYRKSVKLRNIYMRINKNISNEETHLKLIDEMEKLQFWFIDEFDCFKNKFRPYMSFNNKRTP